MEFRSPPRAGGRTAEVSVRDPEGAALATVQLAQARLTVGRISDLNDIALRPDPQQLVTRAGHCALERDGDRWLVVDGGSVNGTFLRRGGALSRVVGRPALHDGDSVCVTGCVT